MALDNNGKLIEETTSGNRPYVFGDKYANAQRNILVDKNGNELNKSNPIYARNPMEYFAKSNEIKPSGDIIKGSTLFEIDTSTAYMWDGSSWVVI